MIVGPDEAKVRLPIVIEKIELVKLKFVCFCIKLHNDIASPNSQ
jgi:hypothetical protein